LNFLILITYWILVQLNIALPILSLDRRVSKQRDCHRIRSQYQHTSLVRQIYQTTSIVQSCYKDHCVPYVRVSSWTYASRKWGTRDSFEIVYRSSMTLFSVTQRLITRATNSQFLRPLNLRNRAKFELIRQCYLSYDSIDLKMDSSYHFSSDLSL
jgi:hypothetical protein